MGITRFGRSVAAGSTISGVGCLNSAARFFCDFIILLPADPLDLELSIDLLNWLNEQGLQCEWLVNCESLSDVLWYGSPLKVMHVAHTDFDKQLRSLKPKFLIVDGLPFGSKGECYEAIEKVPSMWIASFALGRVFEKNSNRKS